MNGFFADGRWWDVTDSDRDMIKGGAERLAVAGIEDALSEARKLFGAAYPRRYADATEEAVETLRARYLDLIDRRAQREPLSHLVGYRDFYKHRFHVSSAVLDPRPDTETLVVEALKHPFKNVLDLGTGSGCILLSLLAERPEATGVGTDVSEAALAVAAQNMRKLEVDHRTTLMLSDWFEDVTGPFDLIVSNPPYIAVNEMADLQPEVRDYEPRIALTDEADGLACYSSIVAGARNHLTNGGRLIVEIGPTQADAVSALMADQGFADIRVIQDLDGRNRVVSAEFVQK